MAKANDAAVVVFTAETKRDILGVTRGSGDWVVNPKSVERCHYLVCCRRSDWKNKAEGFAHGAAFLVGRIAELEKMGESANARGQSRYRIKISDYAEINAPDIWRKQRRNPVTYDSLGQLGIALGRLKFRPLPEPSIAADTRGGLTIALAKAGLAATFGVRPEDIEIIIKG